MCVSIRGKGVFEKGKEDVKAGSQVCISVNSKRSVGFKRPGGGWFHEIVGSREVEKSSRRG